MHDDRYLHAMNVSHVLSVGLSRMKADYYVIDDKLTLSL